MRRGKGRLRGRKDVKAEGGKIKRKEGSEEGGR